MSKSTGTFAAKLYSIYDKPEGWNDVPEAWTELCAFLTSILLTYAKRMGQPKRFDISESSWNKDATDELLNIFLSEAFLPEDGNGSFRAICFRTGGSQDHFEAAARKTADLFLKQRWQKINREWDLISHRVRYALEITPGLVQGPPPNRLDCWGLSAWASGPHPPDCEIASESDLEDVLKRRNELKIAIPKIEEGKHQREELSIFLTALVSNIGKWTPSRLFQFPICQCLAPEAIALSLDESRDNVIADGRDNSDTDASQESDPHDDLGPADRDEEPRVSNLVEIIATADKIINSLNEEQLKYLRNRMANPKRKIVADGGGTEKTVEEIVRESVPNSFNHLDIAHLWKALSDAMTRQRRKHQ